MTAPSHVPADVAAMPPLRWLVHRAKLSKPGLASLATAVDGDTLLSSLLAAGHVVDAAKLVASALPPREGVWWAWTAATHATKAAAATSPITPEVELALGATERWIAQPDDEHRRAVWEASQAAGMETAAGSAAGAAYFTGGSIAPQDVMQIPPPAGIHAMMTFVAVVSASATDADHFDAQMRTYIAQGSDLVRQLGGWETSVGHARTHHDAMHEQHHVVASPPAAADGPAAS